MKDKKHSLPEVIAGPILRKVSKQEVNFWLVTSRPSNFDIDILDQNGVQLEGNLGETLDIEQVKIGCHAYINLLTIALSSPLHEGERYYYELYLTPHSERANGKLKLSALLADFLYDDQVSASFVYRESLTNILHGSCRKPHHDSSDGLIAVDAEIEKGIKKQREHPDLLIMSGDQAYIDDVAGPMLVAIHQVIERLGLFDTTLPLEGEVSSRHIKDNQTYYRRHQLLPDIKDNEKVISQFLTGKRKPIFTSVNANNHLITFAEVMAMYILIWSPEMWRKIDFDQPDFKGKLGKKYCDELKLIKQFSNGLGQVRRALAHLPVYMIFDDHDVTDDWNLTRGWEEAVYNHPFAKRIVGNALIGYWLCQAWGNGGIAMKTLSGTLLRHFTEDGLNDHDALIDTLLGWNQWHYCIDSQPKVVVLDTRTQRWRSESAPNKPSGLMDWESLSELQQELIGQPAVILVSAAPIFGVKLIETIQRIFTFFGKPLMVDAENWMAHRGTASVILNIFRHAKTPPNFVILSGDVHYSFTYDITLKYKKNSPQITQVTSSGIKNEFPDLLLKIFDYLNRILYGSKSPLNWFTKRRHMKVKHRKPEGYDKRTLLNASGIGQLKITENCKHVDTSIIRPAGNTISFIPRDR